MHEFIIFQTFQSYPLPQQKLNMAWPTKLLTATGLNTTYTEGNPNIAWLIMPKKPK